MQHMAWSVMNIGRFLQKLNIKDGGGWELGSKTVKGIDRTSYK